MLEQDTFDLEAAFRDLQRDVAGGPRPGASAAMRAARNRRRTTIGAVAAGLALVAAAGVLGPRTLGHGAPPADAAIRMGQLPPPAPFHDADFNRVFAGWESGWAYDDQLGQDPKATLSLLSSPPCFDDLTTRGGRPVGRVSKDGTVVSGDHSSTAFTLWTTTRSPGAASDLFDTWVAEADRCAGAERLHDRVWTGGEVITWQVPTADGVQGQSYLWLTRAGNGFGAAIVGTGRGRIPDDVEATFADALVAGVQSPSSGGPG